jgi:hypothetical protein
MTGSILKSDPRTVQTAPNAGRRPAASLFRAAGQFFGGTKSGTCCGSQSRAPIGTARRLAAFVPVLLAVLACGCASQHRFVGSRPFDFQKDTFAYPNDLVWEYHFDANGKWVHQRREPQPDYTHHCFVVARSARQFFENARFDTNQPVADEATYRRLVRRVISIDPRHALPDQQRIVIPGYGNLHEFSEAQEKVLKSECGGAWHSYFQRGHWRMIFPFSRRHQAATVERLLADLKENRPPVVHIVKFPQLTINHALLVFGAAESEKQVQFSIYDPNKPDKPKILMFDRATRTFSFAGNDYWPGGRVDIYEIYRSWDY